MDSQRPLIRGLQVDAQGRCAHYHSDWDVVANRCAECGQWWACYRCHEETDSDGDTCSQKEGAVSQKEGTMRTQHSFAPMPVTALAVLCGVCGYEMCYEEYSSLDPVACPSCAHSFNPGCSAHASLYFALEGAPHGGLS